MDRKKYKKLKYSDIITTENGRYFLILRSESNKKILTPLQISLGQIKIIRSIIGNNYDRNDIYFQLKKEKYFKNFRSLFIKNKDSGELENIDKKKENIEILDGIIIALDNKLPIYTGNNMLLNGIYEYFDDFMDYDDIFDEDNLM
jgi:hypothetical protein